MNLGGEVRSLERVSEGVTTEDLGGGGSGLVIPQPEVVFHWDVSIIWTL